jgi:hypothetical protein
MGTGATAIDQAADAAARTLGSSPESPEATGK